MTNSSAKYVKKSHLEHVLDRPDSYVGSCEGVSEKQWVLNEDRTRIGSKTIDVVPGLYKIYDEVLNNAIDQSVLDPSLDCIKVTVCPEEGVISVYNTTGTGSDYGIPVEMHPTYQVYTPELIFGNLLTSSNYDDTQERVTGGRNGYGAKLANIFSKWFEVEVADMSRNLHYLQRFENNMKTVQPPKIKPLPKSVKKGFVRIRFSPDLARFKNHGKPMDKLDSDTLALFERRAYDAAACTRPDVAVYYNDKKIPIKSFDKYVDLFLGGSSKEKQRAYEKLDDRWEVCVAASQDVETEPDDVHGFLQMSFVNGIATTKGGTHITFLLSQLLEKIKTTVKKASDLKPFDLRERMFLFVRCTIVNPVFSSQTKEECTSKLTALGGKVDMPDTFIKKVAKIEGIVDAALERSMQRLMTKTDGAKRNTINVPKLEDASKAGTADSHKCTLVLTEGDSAKTFAISGLSEVDRRYWGVFPLRGKLLNVRDASARQVAENQEITYLKQILGLQHGKVYDSVSGLRYGRVMILTDADDDGLHIKGLVLNFFHTFWPSLLKLDFVCTMNTPVVKVFKGTQTIKVFYTVKEYKNWKDSTAGGDLKGLRIKYYKGLGTSTAVEAKEYFKQVTQNTVLFNRDAASDDAMELAFRKNQTSKRKDWVSSAASDETSIDATRSKTVAIADFINKDLVLFSMADVIRSIPNIMDGMKPSQRKVLYACIRRNLTQEIRVSQLAGSVSEITSYHHGEQSLCGTIVGMAQNFVGSNNMNPLAPIGQFGTRLSGGKDCASPRYIFTKLEPWVNKVFCPSDEPLLTYLDDDGTSIEPRIYYPVLPMVLVNGAEGIGTGFSTYVPPYNPKDIIDNIGRHIRGETMRPMSPWFQGFKGQVRQKAETSFEVCGVVEWDGTNKVVIKELPIGLWTTDYKESLDNSTRLSGLVHSYENLSSEKDVLFKVRLKDDAVDKVRQDPLKELDLVRVIHTNNMHLFDESGVIRKYEDAREILSEFCKCRQQVYGKRKARLLQDMAAESETLRKEVLFVKLVVDGQLVVFKRKVPDVLADMKTHGLEDPELLKMPITRFTQEHIDAMLRKQQVIVQEISMLERTTPTELWFQDLAKV